MPCVSPSPGRFSRRIFAAALIAVALASPCNATDADDASPPSAEWTAAHYRELERITPEPVLADPMLLVACTTLKMAQVDSEIAKDGPHAFLHVAIYMDRTAAEAFRAHAKSYPVGATIVKEKVPNAGFAPPPGTKPVSMPPIKSADPALDARMERLFAAAGTGGMIKRERGYDPAHGDWEYFYFTDAAKVEHGKLDSCGACHEKARGTDRVFGSWAPHMTNPPSGRERP
jgi:hypothetical protein